MKNKIPAIEPVKEYQWNQNWANRIAHTDINLVVAELKDIEDAYGEVTPTLIIESSKNKKSVLHGYFEWDDEKAANSWRLYQAKKLIREIQVKVITDGEAKFIRVYETTQKQFGQQSMKYTRHDALTTDNLDYIKMVLISDLRKIKNKVDAYFNKDACEFIEKAIEILSKESTETKIEDKPALTAA